jgi:hypothetical protein
MLVSQVKVRVLNAPPKLNYCQGGASMTIGATDYGSVRVRK